MSVGYIGLCMRCGQNKPIGWRILLGGLSAMLCVDCNNAFAVFIHSDADVLTEYHQAGARYSQAVQGHMSIYEADPAIENFLVLERAMQARIDRWLRNEPEPSGTGSASELSMDDVITWINGPHDDGDE